MNRIARPIVLLLATGLATGAFAQVPAKHISAGAPHGVGTPPKHAEPAAPARTASSPAPAAPATPQPQAAPASSVRVAPAAVTSARPHSGDAWVDARLRDIDAYAATYRDAFVDDVVRYGRGPRDLVQSLLARPGWTPGDVYAACGLALQAGRPCRDVAAMRDADPSHDWATIAGDLDIAPGTPSFHAFKRAIIASYDRWARPVMVDDEMAHDFPTRPRAPAPRTDTHEAPRSPQSH